MRFLILAVMVALAADAGAQALPAEPISVANGRFVFGAEIVATIGEADPGFFTYTDYEFSALRNVRAAVSTEVRASRHVQLLAEVRLDRGDRVSAYAMFVRLRPWPDRRFDVQVGRVPPAFGAFLQTIYAYRNPVIGQPLAYQYLLSIKPSAVPDTGADLLRMRGRGWRSDFPIGDPTPSPGVPLINTARFDTGVQVHGVAGPIEWTGAVTAGSLSEPLVVDNNGRPQLAARVLAHTGPGLRLGLSASTAAWLDGSLDGALPRPAREFRQSAVGLDAEASAGAWLMRAEWLRSVWQVPAFDDAPRAGERLGAQSFILEGRYRIAPGLTVGARGDALWFSDVAGPAGAQPWEADVRRLELGLGVAITRNVTAKVAWQRNHRDGGRIRRDSLAAGQLVYWF